MTTSKCETTAVEAPRYFFTKLRLGGRASRLAVLEAARAIPLSEWKGSRLDPHAYGRKVRFDTVTGEVALWFTAKNCFLRVGLYADGTKASKAVEKPVTVECEGVLTYSPGVMRSAVPGLPEGRWVRGLDGALIAIAPAEEGLYKIAGRFVPEESRS